VTLATPPAVKALVVKTLRLNAYQIDASSGQYYVHFAVGACGGSQANVFYGHEMTTKIDEFSFEPGLIIPAGQSLVATPSAPSGTFLFTEVSGEGYKTAASSVPAPAAAANVGPTEATAKPPGPSR
jgi:hypothetical protein